MATLRQKVGLLLMQAEESDDTIVDVLNGVKVEVQRRYGKKVYGRRTYTFDVYLDGAQECYRSTKKHTFDTIVRKTDPVLIEEEKQSAVRRERQRQEDAEKAKVAAERMKPLVLDVKNKVQAMILGLMKEWASPVATQTGFLEREVLQAIRMVVGEVTE